MHNILCTPLTFPMTWFSKQRWQQWDILIILCQSKYTRRSTHTTVILKLWIHHQIAKRLKTNLASSFVYLCVLRVHGVIGFLVQIIRAHNFTRIWCKKYTKHPTSYQIVYENPFLLSNKSHDYHFLSSVCTWNIQRTIAYRRFHFKQFIALTVVATYVSVAKLRTVWEIATLSFKSSKKHFLESTSKMGF